jgi:hypothetical protein
MMKNSFWLFLIFAAALTGCQKDNFFDKFPPEIMFFEGANVENANFITTSLPADSTAYTLKARVSAPFGLKEIQVSTISGSSETEVGSITDFGNSPNETFVFQRITNISGNTDVKFLAKDKDGRATEKIFKILKN